MSINKLGEYLVSNASRRRSIVKQAKAPPVAIVPRYRQAFPPLAGFFKTANEDHILRAIEELRTKPAKTEWQADDNLNTALALEVFLQDAKSLLKEGCEFKAAPLQEKRKLPIEGVEVSVRPDFYILHRRRCQDLIGAVKFHWIKDDAHKLTNLGGQYVATTLHQFLETHQQHKAKPSLEHCLSIDVFRHSICIAPKSHVRMRQTIEAGCQEIALWWDKVE